MTEILVLSAGRRVSLVRAFQEVARPRGIRVVTADLQPSLSSACSVSDKNIVLPHVLDEAYSSRLMEYCLLNNVKLIIPTIDTELSKLSLLRNDLLSQGCVAAVSDAGIINVCRDKRRTADFFEKFGIQSPKIYDPESLPYPILVKPYDGSLSVGISILKSPLEMTNSILHNPKNIFCEYIDPKYYDEYTCDTYFDNDGFLLCVVPRLRIEVRGGEVSKGRTERNNIVQFLFEKLARVEGARGCLTIQIMRHRIRGDLYLLEVNPRFGGGYPLTAKSGATYHEWLIREYLDGATLKRFDNWEDNLTMLRYDSEVFVTHA